MAWERVAHNAGARSAGVDGLTARAIESESVPDFLAGLREQVKSGRFAPSPVREKLIPKSPSRGAAPKSLDVMHFGCVGPLAYETWGAHACHAPAGHIGLVLAIVMASSTSDATCVGDLPIV